MVKMKALDTLHVSSVGPENIKPGDEFEVSEGFAVSLEGRGLARRLKAAPAEKAEDKAERAPLPNKMEQPLANKSAITMPAKAKRV